MVHCTIKDNKDVHYCRSEESSWLTRSKVPAVVWCLEVSSQPRVSRMQNTMEKCAHFLGRAFSSKSSTSTSWYLFREARDRNALRAAAYWLTKSPNPGIEKRKLLRPSNVKNPLVTSSLDCRSMSATPSSPKHRFGDKDRVGM